MRADATTGLGKWQGQKTLKFLRVILDAGHKFQGYKINVTSKVKEFMAIIGKLSDIYKGIIYQTMK